jgi:hypothetical protein
VKDTVAPASFFSILSTFAPEKTSMPRFLYWRSNSLEMSSSSTLTIRGSASRIVTSAPKLLKTEANSTPTAPAPMTISDLGMAGRVSISIFVRMVSSAL